MMEAIIFDFDGVILESADIKTEAFVELFADLSPEHREAVRSHHLANLGVSRYRKFEWVYDTLLGRPLPPDESELLGRRFSEIALRRVLEAPFVAGAAEALSDLSASHDLFVASGTPQEELDHVVSRRGLTDYFREVWGSPRTKPEIITDIMGRHGFSPAVVLMIGDGASDHRAALATGVQFLARDTPSQSSVWQDLAVRRVPDLRGLVEVVGNWS